jgi:hypothetical protein
VGSALDAFGTKAQGVILDPMNGSGTTTMAAERCGVPCIGIEMNPAIAAIARAKNATLAYDSEIQHALSEVVKRARALKPNIPPTPEILSWLSRETYTELRSLEAAINSLKPPKPPTMDKRVQAVLSTSDARNRAKNPHQEFMTAALLLTLRRLAKVEPSKNPTWIKRSQINEAADVCVHETFLRVAESMRNDLRAAFPEPVRQQTSFVIDGDARRMPIKEKSIDLIITSPPYLTRIDYAVTTAPEITFLGYSTKDEFHQLRRTIMGSTCISGGSYETPKSWGRACLTLLGKIKEHPSKASAGYYFKTFVQYFRDTEAIVREYLRVLKPGAPCVLVLQDSWYKDVHVPLTRIYSEIAEQLGVVDIEMLRTDEVRNHMGLVNTRARKYAKGELREHVLLFRKAEQ